MYKSYKRELWTYTGENYEEELKDWFNEMFTNPNMIVRPIRSGHTNSLIGFISVEALTKEQQEESGCKWFISETYILPSNRNKGYMTSIMSNFVDENKGNVGLVVLKKNIKADKFWKDTFGRMGYETEIVPYLGNENETFYRFVEPVISRSSKEA